ncbi:MAG: hypothetical protein ACHQO8_04055 [Vicinamibacterales bacterium]
MADKMTLVFVKETCHVVGAVTRRTAVPDTIGPSDVVGDVFERHDAVSGGSRVQIEVDALKTANVPLALDVIVDPTSYAVVDNQPKFLLRFAIGSEPSVNVTATGITVHSVPLASDPTKVWVHVDGGNNVHAAYSTQVRAKSPSDPSGAAEEATLTFHWDPGTYTIFTLIQGYAPLAIATTTI